MEHISSIELQKGNPLIFEKLFDTWYESLCRYAYSILHDMNEAEEIVQKIFYKIWDQHTQLFIHSSIKSYLYRMVHNECMNLIAKKKRTIQHHKEYSTTQSYVTSNTADHVVCSDLEAAIAKGLAELPPKCRQVFEMSRMEQLSYAEIAKEMGISVNTVENQMSKALKTMRISLKEFLILSIILTFFNS